MNNEKARLFYLATELRPNLPDKQFMNMIGPWGRVIAAGAEHGLGGCTAALPEASFAQISAIYEQGILSGASPDEQEFRSLLAGVIFEAISENDKLAALEKIRLYSKLHTWVQGNDNGTEEAVLDWDAEVAVPDSTVTGFKPLDELFGGAVMQELYTILAQPEQMKTTTCLAIAKQWKVSGIGPVVMLQTEMAPAPTLLKIRGMGNEVFQKGIDKLYFGGRNTEDGLEWLIDNPDTDRLVIFDSISGHCGQGDSAAERQEYSRILRKLVAVKNASRLVIACSHLKRGVEVAGINDAAGSSVIERLSGCMLQLEKSDTPRPDGLIQMKMNIIKNRWGGHNRPSRYLINPITGETFENDVDAFENTYEPYDAEGEEV